MSTGKELMSGSSEARERQGGDCPGPPPRSCAQHVSRDGLPTVLSASGVGTTAIAEERDRDKEEGMEVTWEEKAKERAETGAIGMDEGSTTSDWECSDEEFERRLGRAMKIFLPTCLGEFTESEERRMHKQIREDYRAFRKGDKPNYMVDLIVDVGRIALNPEESDSVKRMNIVGCANTAKKVVETFEREINMKEEMIKRYKERYIDMEKKHKKRYIDMEKKYKEMKEKYETIVRKETKEEETQTPPEVCRGKEAEGVVNRGNRLEEKVESLVKRVEQLERGIPWVEEDASRVEEEEEVPWTKVLGRRRKIEREKERREKASTQREQEKERRQRSRSGTRPLRALMKKLPKGSGVMIEIQGGGSKDYQEVIKECERAISLEEMGIPSMEMRTTRGGGILLTIQGDKEEEKAEKLAGRIRKIIEKKEGARVWSLRKRVRLRLTGIPPGIKKEDVANMIAKEGGVEVGRIGVGPLRTLASGAGAAWVDCPREAAARVAGAPGLVMGWARVGVSPVEGGAPNASAA